MSDSTIRFNVAYISVLSVLFVQFGGVVWYASELNSDVKELSDKVTKLEKNLTQETEKTAPIIYEFKHINMSLGELKQDIKDIKESLEHRAGK